METHLTNRDATAPTNGSVSFWYKDIGLPERRPALNTTIVADVCVVGGGFTGLWTAYYLKEAKPDLKVVVLEREFAGFGASGRNGGNLTGRFPWVRKTYLKHSSPDRLLAMEKALNKTVFEVLDVARREGIDADINRAGNLSVATTLAQQARQQAVVAELARAIDDEALKPRLLDRDGLLSRVRVHNGLSAVHSQNSARVQPAKLVRGLAAAAERRGVVIFEDTAAETISKNFVQTAGGGVHADIIVRATEGYTSQLPGHERKLIPLNSAIIVTEPLPESVWRELGWQGLETLSETSYAYSYCQRTREGRITVGGRGVPYRFGSATDVNGQTQDQTISMLKADLRRLFPQVADARIDHAWCGVLGVPRDWCASVGFDRASGQAWGGGYVGGGIAASNLAGRTLRDLILGRDTELTSFPWINHAVKPWEPEPFRWLGINTIYSLYQISDYQERKGGAQTSQFARLANFFAGRKG